MIDRYLLINVNPLLLTRYFISIKKLSSLFEHFSFIQKPNRKIVIENDELIKVKSFLKGQRSITFPGGKSSVVAKILKKIIYPCDEVAELSFSCDWYLKKVIDWYKLKGIEFIGINNTEANFNFNCREGIILYCPKMNNLRIELITKSEKISNSMINSFLRHYYLKSIDVNKIIISGSYVDGLSKNFLNNLILKSKQKDKFFFIDSVLFNYKYDIFPDFLKINHEEASLIFNYKIKSIIDSIAILSSLPKDKNVIITFSSEGTIARFDNKVYHFHYNNIKNIINPVGAGDSFMSILSFLINKNYSLFEIIKMATCNAAKNVEEWNEGNAIDINKMFRLANKYTIIRRLY